MSESQKQTIIQYQRFLQSMATAACLKSACELGVFQALRGGQKDLQQLAAASNCDPAGLEDLARVLVAAGAIESYGEDLAISQAIGLLASTDADMGQSIWQGLSGYLQNPTSILTTERLSQYRQRIVTRQWSHTAAAMQAAEVLGIGSALRGLNVLELGSGAGVWSAAMAYRDPKLRITSVDEPAMIAQCQATYASIELLERVNLIEDDYRTWSPPLGQFDLVILPEVVQLDQDPAAVVLLGRAADALREGGQVIILETLREADGPALTLATQGLELAVATGGRQRTATQIQRLLIGAGFGEAQWGWLTASPHGIGLVVASKVEAT